LIRRDYAWEAVQNICDNYPETIELARSPTKNDTVLHEICSVGSAPMHLFEKVLCLWKGACLIQNKDGDTPLHIATRCSQISSHKAKLLVCCCADALAIKNNSGDTPLNVALISKAAFPVIKIILEKDKSLLMMVDDNGQTPSQKLWESFNQTIPGLIAMKKYLKGDVEMSNLLRRFWITYKYCSLEMYKLTQNIDDAEDNSLCHAILTQNLKEKYLHEALILGLKCCPSAAYKRSHDGRMPLHVALERYGQDSGARKMIRSILRANFDALACKDISKCGQGLYPFMTAAVLGDTSLTFEFLILRPDTIALR